MVPRPLPTINSDTQLLVMLVCPPQAHGQASDEVGEQIATTLHAVSIECCTKVDYVNEVLALEKE